MRSTQSGRSAVQTLSRHPTPRLPKVELVVLAASNACLMVHFRQHSGVALATIELGVGCSRMGSGHRESVSTWLFRKENALEF